MVRFLTQFRMMPNKTTMISARRYIYIQLYNAIGRYLAAIKLTFLRKTVGLCGMFYVADVYTGVSVILRCRIRWRRLRQLV